MRNTYNNNQFLFYFKFYIILNFHYSTSLSLSFSLFLSLNKLMFYLNYSSISEYYFSNFNKTKWTSIFFYKD